MDGEGYPVSVWRAGEVVPPGAYMRVDDELRRIVVLEETGPLPPGFDGRVAIYCRAAPRLAPQAPVPQTEPATISPHTQH